MNPVRTAARRSRIVLCSLLAAVLIAAACNQPATTDNRAAAEAAQSGDLAYVVGTYQITPNNDKGKPMEDRGKLVEVWKKQTDGKWKVVADIFNTDLPAPAPPSAEKK